MLTGKVFRSEVMVSDALLDTAVNELPAGRRTRNLTAPPVLPAFTRKRTTVPSTGDTATGAPPEVWTYVHEIPPEQIVEVAVPARLLPIVTSAAEALAGSRRKTAAIVARAITCRAVSPIARLRNPAGTEPCAAASGLRQRLGLGEVHVRHLHDHELCDAVARRDVEGRCLVGVEQQHPQLSA